MNKMNDFSIFYYSFDENLLISLKYNILKRMFHEMMSINIEIRPDCDQIIRSKRSWAIGFNEFKNNLQLKEYSEVQSIDESFHKYFIQQKFKYHKNESNTNVFDNMKRSLKKNFQLID
jgi:hypothetical protein